MDSNFLVEALCKYLIGLGVAVSHEFIIDFLKPIINKNIMNLDQLKARVREYFNIEDSSASEGVINFLVSNGAIAIVGMNVFANKLIEYKSFNLGKIILKNEVFSSTPSTLIKIGIGCSITMTGDASIKQEG